MTLTDATPTITNDTITNTADVSLPPATGRALAEALDGPFHATKQRWRDELDADDVVRDPSLDLAGARAWTLERIQRLSARNFVTAGFPAAVGGTGTSAESVANFEMMAMGDLSLTIKSGVQHGLFGGAIANLGNEWHHETFLPRVIDCSLLGCFAMTELGHGSDVQSVETTITWVPETGEYEVDSPTPTARKAYIGNAGADGRMAAVFGQLYVDGENQGVHTILVPIRAEDGSALAGVDCGDQGHKGGLLGVDNGTIAFDHVRVGREMLLDRFGGVGEDGVYHSDIESKNARFFTMLGTLVRGRICVGGGAASSCRRALSIATRYSLQRTQFRKPGLGEEVTLLDYQAHQRKLLPNIARAYAYGLAQNDLALELQAVLDLNACDQRDEARSRELESRAAGMKALLTRWANDTIQVCREACGGQGYLSGNGITLARQDADVFATFEGDNTVLNQLVAKALLLDYRKAWGEMDLRGTAQATAKMAVGAVRETSALALVNRLGERVGSRASERELLTTREWQRQMFAFREEHALAGLAARMRKAAKLPKEEQFEAINRVQTHMLFVARANTERRVLEAFIAGIKATKDAKAATVLSELCDLYALSSIEADAAWFMEHNRISPARSKSITQGVDTLCRELRPHALALVEGMGVPHQWLQADCLK